MPFFTSYNQADYNFGSQNFGVLVGDDQRIYFANTEGILVFDGINWTKLVLPQKVQPYSLTKAANGTIYVGAVNEIGYLSTDPKGNLTYTSLKDLLGDFDDSFTTWYNYILNDEVYFATSHHLFVYNPTKNKIRIINSPDAKWSTRINHKQLYAYRNDSLYQLVNDNWKALRPSKLYAEKQIQKVLFAEFTDGKTLVVSNQGFFDFETDKRIDIDNDLTDFLAQTTPYNLSLIHI